MAGSGSGGGFFPQMFSQLRRERLTRARVFEILSSTRNPEDRVGRFSDIFLIVLIVLNVLAVMLESVPAFGEPYRNQFFLFEGVSVFFFTLEYVARIWTAPEHPKFADKGPVWGRIRYALSPMALTDLVAIIPFYIVLSGTTFFDLRFLRVLRLRRAFKLTRYSPDMSIVLGVLRDELRLILALAFVLALLVVMGSSLIFVLEGKDDGPFGSIPGAMKWALENLTTVGNAGIVPESTMGQAFATVLGIVGVVFVSMFSGIFAAGFVNARHKRHTALRRYVKLQLVLNDGDLGDTAMAAITAQRKALGFTEADALEIINEALEEHAGLDRAALLALARRDDRMLLDD